VKCAAFIVLAWAALSRADEGMWLFSDPPRQQLRQKHAFDVTKSWLEHLQKSSVQIGGGGSGAFVSHDGLLVTNQHVAVHWLRRLPADKRELLRDGFHADSRADEISCPGLEVRVPWESEDVTRRVHEAIKPEMSMAEARRARVAVCRALEKESQNKSGLISRVEALDDGGRYHLFRYKAYADVRLVFVPEDHVSRVYDFCFLRAYENGRPARVDHFLHWGGPEARVGELVFIAGFPAQTSRALTTADLNRRYQASVAPGRKGAK